MRYDLRSDHPLLVVFLRLTQSTKSWKGRCIRRNTHLKGPFLTKYRREGWRWITYSYSFPWPIRVVVRKKGRNYSVGLVYVGLQETRYEKVTSSDVSFGFQSVKTDCLNYSVTLRILLIVRRNTKFRFPCRMVNFNWERVVLKLASYRWICTYKNSYLYNF